MLKTSKPFRIAILASGGGTNFQSFLDAQKSGTLKAQIVCLFTNKPDCGAAKKAKVAGIPVAAVESKGKDRLIYDREVMAALEPYTPDLVVLGGYMRIVGPQMVARYKNRIINIHPSLLPRHAGLMDRDVHAAVLKAGDRETGITIHFVDEGVDTGRILLQKKVAVAPNDTVETLRAKVQALEKEWYPKVIESLPDAE